MVEENKQQKASREVLKHVQAKRQSKQYIGLVKKKKTQVKETQLKIKEGEKVNTSHQHLLCTAIAL